MKHKSTHRLAFVFCLACVGMIHGTSVAADGSNKLLVYIGTYTSAGSEGIYACELDPLTGEIQKIGVTSGVKNPSFLAIHPSQRFVYTVSEVSDFADSHGGAVTGFALDRQTGQLTPINSQSSGGAGPCHLVVDASGKNVLVANYGGGSVAVLPIDADGKLSPASSFEQHRGSSVNPQRQEGPHAHSINMDARNRFAVAADLGLDKVLIYRFESEHGTLAANDPSAASVKPGSGPRHFAFHPDGRHAYVINELNLTVTVFDYDSERGALTEIQTIWTLPSETGYVAKGYSTAEVLVHPSGKFLYGSNRGHDTIAMFVIDPETGKLKPPKHFPTGGRTPRNFNLDPDGKFLLAANQDSGTVNVFSIDQQTGRLTNTGHKVEVPMPVCIRFVTR